MNREISPSRDMLNVLQKHTTTCNANSKQKQEEEEEMLKKWKESIDDHVKNIRLEASLAPLQAGIVITLAIFGFTLSQENIGALITSIDSKKLNAIGKAVLDHTNTFSETFKQPLEKIFFQSKQTYYNYVEKTYENEKHKIGEHLGFIQRILSEMCNTYSSFVEAEKKIRVPN